MNDSSSYHNTHLELDQFLIISESSSRLSVTEGWYHLRLRVSSCLARIISKSLIGGDRYIQGMIGKNTDLLFYCEIDDRVDDWSVFFVVSEPGIFWILREREKKQREVSMAITRPKAKGVARSRLMSGVIALHGINQLAFSMQKWDRLRSMSPTYLIRPWCDAI